MRWSSVDLDERTIWIRHAVARLVSGELIQKDPKSHQTRQVLIDSTTCRILRDHHDYQLSIASKVGCVLRPDAFVIADLVVDPTGGVPVRPDRLTQAFKRITDRVLGACEVCLHDLRHWYATTQLHAGESLPAVAARIGDHVETLAKVYAHRGHSSDRAAADVLGARLDGSPSCFGGWVRGPLRRASAFFTTSSAW